MNGTSNAVVLQNEERFENNSIIRVNCTAKRNMKKQRLCGIGLLMAILTSSVIIGDIETVFFMIPAALFLIFTKKSILTFDYE